MITIKNIVSINQPSIPNFTDPLGLLVHCHERIEGQLRSLLMAADLLRRRDQSSLAHAFEAIDMACAHFRVPGVKHTEDEEISLFPRLREHESSAIREALAAIEELESQHRDAEKLHEELDGLVIRIPRDGSAEERDVDRYGELVTQLANIYRPHILIENELVFPAASRALSQTELQALGAEMRARRQFLLQAR